MAPIRSFIDLYRMFVRCALEVFIRRSFIPQISLELLPGGAEMGGVEAAVVYQFNTIPVKFPAGFCLDFHKLIKNLYAKTKGKA